MSRTRNQRMNKNSQTGRNNKDKTTERLAKNRHFTHGIFKTKNIKILLAILIGIVVILSVVLVFEYQNISGKYYFKNNRNTNSLPTSIGDFSKVSGSQYFINGKIPVLFVGSLACPYCAQVSWTIYYALHSSGGSWSGLAFDYSNVSDKYPNTPGLNFANASYSNSKVSFQGYEISNRNWQPYQTLNSTNDAFFNQYDSAGNIPFILIGGIYAHIGETFVPSILNNITGQNIIGWLDSGTNNTVTDNIVNESRIVLDVIQALQNSNVSSGSSYGYTNFLNLLCTADVKLE